MRYDDFFKIIKEERQLSDDSELKSLIASSLRISESGAYKKMKGITKLTLDEASVLSNKLGLSIDIQRKEEPTSYLPFEFYCDDLVAPPSTYEQWASNILNHSLDLNKFRPDYEVYSYQSEISYFHLMPFRYLLYFKLYAWNRSSWKIRTSPKFNLSEFSSNHALNSLLDQINDHFVSYNGIEIWHVNLLDGVLNQITYFHQLNIFEKKDEIELILKDLIKLINHLKDIAEHGKKKKFGGKEYGESMKVYLNYTHTSSSVMFIKTSHFKMIYNLFLHPNYIRTSDEHVCNYTERWIQKAIQQSELISGSGEIIRNNFFTNLENKILQLQDVILNH